MKLRIFLATSVMATLVASAPAHAALVAYWNFDEPSGTTAADSVGTLDGTLSGAAAFVPAGGIAGGAVSLPGSGGSYVNMANALGFATGDFSISVWVNSTATGANNFPVSKHMSGSANGYFFNLNTTAGYGAPDKAMFYVTTPTGSEVVSSTTVNNGVWHNIVGVYHSGGTKSIYVDGTPAEQTNAAEAMTTNTASFMVGGINVGGTPTTLFTGMVDELRVYDHALADPEIQDLFDCPDTGVCPPTTTTTSTSTTTTTMEPLCDSTPRVGCDTAAAGKGSLSISRPGGGKDKFKWKLGSGAASETGDFGNPVAGGVQYAYCIYDGSVSAQPRFLALLDVGFGWKAAGGGFSYSKKTGSSAGITKVKLKPGVAGKTQLQVQGQGANLVLPALPLTGSVTAQFVVRDDMDTACWSVVFPVPSKSDATHYSAKGP